MTIAMPGIRLRQALTLTASLLVGLPAGGCFESVSPRYQAPFTLSSPDERHPIKLAQEEATLELAVHSNGYGLNQAQLDALHLYLYDYGKEKGERLIIRVPSGGSNESGAVRAAGDVRASLRRAGISPEDVLFEPYASRGDVTAPLHLSFLHYVAQAPDCPDWSENVARDPQNMPWPNMGCAVQRNLAASIDDPRDLIEPRGETPRSGERRDVVWGNYVNGKTTGADYAPEKLPLSEHANVSDMAGGSAQ